MTKKQGKTRLAAWKSYKTTKELDQAMLSHFKKKHAPLVAPPSNSSVVTSDGVVLTLFPVLQWLVDREIIQTKIVCNGKKWRWESNTKGPTRPPTHTTLPQLQTICQTMQQKKLDAELLETLLNDSILSRCLWPPVPLCVHGVQTLQREHKTPASQCHHLNENDLSLSYNKTDTNGSNSAASVLWFWEMCQPWTGKVVSKKRHRSATESENDVDVQQPWSSTGGRKYLLRLEDEHGVTHETFNSRVVCTVAIDCDGDELVVGSAPARRPCRHFICTPPTGNDETRVVQVPNENEIYTIVAGNHNNGHLNVSSDSFFDSNILNIHPLTTIAMQCSRYGDTEPKCYSSPFMGSGSTHLLHTLPTRAVEIILSYLYVSHFPDVIELYAACACRFGESQLSQLIHNGRVLMKMDVQEREVRVGLQKKVWSILGGSKPGNNYHHGHMNTSIMESFQFTSRGVKANSWLIKVDFFFPFANHNVPTKISFWNSPVATIQHELTQLINRRALIKQLHVAQDQLRRPRTPLKVCNFNPQYVSRWIQAAIAEMKFKTAFQRFVKERKQQQQENLMKQGDEDNTTSFLLKTKAYEHDLMANPDTTIDQAIAGTPLWHRPGSSAFQGYHKDQAFMRTLLGETVRNRGRRKDRGDTFRTDSYRFGNGFGSIYGRSIRDCLFFFYYTIDDGDSFPLRHRCQFMTFALGKYGV